MADRSMTVNFPGGLRVDAVYRNQVIRTDQPVDEGGEGSAPAPFDLFLGSIATCAGYYLLAFCKERGIDMEGAGVTMTMERDPVARMIGTITIELRLPPGFPEKYAAAVVRSIDACAVKRHIIKAPAFKILATFQP
jgi:putative redox protein